MMNINFSTKAFYDKNVLNLIWALIWNDIYVSLLNINQMIVVIMNLKKKRILYGSSLLVFGFTSKVEFYI